MEPGSPAAWARPRGPERARPAAWARGVRTFPQVRVGDEDPAV